MSTSRRDFLATSAAAALVAALGQPRLTRALQGQAPEPVFTPIRRNVGFFTMRGGTIGYLVNPDAVVVVDSQFPAEGKAFLEGVNTRSGNRPVDFLINTHHHGDHTGGNVSFRGAAKKVVAHAKAAEHMRQPPGGQPPADQLYPDTTFTETWSADAGDERVMARHYGRAHTSGDAVITFERANVAHMGDLMSYQRNPRADRPAGASIVNWIPVLENVVKDHGGDTIYIFGHAKVGERVTGTSKDLLELRDYFTAMLDFTKKAIAAGKTQEEVLKTAAIPGFDRYEGTPTALSAAYEELTAK